MEIFSIICLVTLFVVIQHLLNWMWRKCWLSDFATIYLLMVTVVSGVLSFSIIYYIILWGKNLI